MVLAVAQTLHSLPVAGTKTRYLPNVRELVAFCPGCKTMETLWFNDGRLMPTRKFKQQRGQVFHDCGTLEPCRLYQPY